MYNNNEKKSFKHACIAVSVLASLGGTFGTAMAAEEVVIKDEIEKINVTGSRISRTDLESALPVTVIDSSFIVESGFTDISDLLSELPFNTTGSTISDGGSSAANHASSGMRGLGASRTLVLVNGRRIAPSSTAGAASTNLNLIPVDAVDRVEILRDGASAIYGSDAIGGVYNIILKREFEGLALKVNGSTTSDGGYGKSGFSMLFGANSDKSNSVTVIEVNQTDPLKYGQRPHNSVDREKKFNHSSLYAPEGTYRPVAEYGKNTYTGDYVPGKDCPQEWIIADTKDKGFRCGYANTEGKDYLPKRSKASLFHSSTFTLTDELTFDAQVLILRDTSETESSSLWTDKLYMKANNKNNPTYGTDDASDIRVYHRLAGVADRNNKFTSLVIDGNIGFNYNIDAGSLAGSYTYSRQDSDRRINHYAFKDGLQDMVNEERYNPFVLGGNADDDTLNQIRHTATRETESIVTIADLSWASELPIELAGGDIGYAVGVQVLDQSYYDEQDAQTTAGNVQGAYGGNSGGERKYKAAFAEFSLPITEDLIINLATRYDKYDLPDVGQLSSSLNARYQLTDDVVLRASYGEGFKAPSIDELLGERAESYNRVIDRTTCSKDCERNQVLRVSEGNKNLKPETSEQYSVGMVWDITEDIEATFDYYNIEMNNQIQFMGAQTVVNLEAFGLLDNYAGSLYVKRDAEGEIEEVGAGDINMEGYITNGIDWDFKYTIPNDGYGKFGFIFNGSYTLEYSSKDTPTSVRYDDVGYEDVPQYRFNLGANYKYEGFYVSLTYNYIDDFRGESAEEEFERNKAGDEFELDNYDSFARINLTTSYTTDNYGKIVVGARNLTNELPDINYTLRNGYHTDLHSIIGRQIFANYQIKF